MSVLDRILDDTRRAMKANDQIARDTLRLLTSEINLVQKESADELGDSDVVNLVVRLAKQKRESMTYSVKAGRTEAAERHRAEIAVLEDYLPRQLTEPEITERALKVIEATGAKGASDIGKVMSVLSPRMKGIADGGTVAKIVRSLLTQ